MKGRIHPVAIGISKTQKDDEQGKRGEVDAPDAQAETRPDTGGRGRKKEARGDRGEMVREKKK